MKAERADVLRAVFKTGKRAEVIVAGEELIRELLKRDVSQVVLPNALARLNGDFSAAWIDFLADRRERRKPVTSRAAKMILKKLAERPEKAAYALRQCIERRWSSFEWEYFDRRNTAPVAGKSESIGSRFGVGA